MSAEPGYGVPGFWMHESSGALRPVVVAYLEGARMSPYQVAIMRAYLRQWIEAPLFLGSTVDHLRATVNAIATRDDVERWLDLALEDGIDPL